MLDYKNILYPININSKRHSTVVKTLEIAKKSKSRLHFFFVNAPQAGYRFPADSADMVALKVKEVAPPSLLEDMDIVYAASKGELGEEVKKYCLASKIDLIITGHKHHSKLYASFFDSPDENIIDSVKLPVFILPED